MRTEICLLDNHCSIVSDHQMKAQAPTTSQFGDESKNFWQIHGMDYHVAWRNRGEEQLHMTQGNTCGIILSERR